MIMTRGSKHRCFQLEPVEILARWTIEGMSYRTRLPCTQARGMGAYVSTVTSLPEHVGCSQVEQKKLRLESLQRAHALASQALNFPSAGLDKYKERRSASSCGVDEHLGREVEIKADDTVVVVRCPIFIPYQRIEVGEGQRPAVR